MQQPSVCYITAGAVQSFCAVAASNAECQLLVHGFQSRIWQPQQATSLHYMLHSKEDQRSKTSVGRALQAKPCAG
jgi:uncharacterized membrane protein